MKSELNEKQRAFCRYVVQGYSQTEAYIMAGYSERWASANAARMIAYDSVSAEVARLRQEADDAAVAGRKERMLRLSCIMRDGRDEASVLRAVDLLNKMDGAYAPQEQKVELSGTLGVGAVLGVLGVGDMEPLAK